MLKKVISGGQTGVDQAALAAAKTVGLETGGWAPMGWITADGPMKEVLQGYGLEQHYGGYKDRTFANVCHSDATIRIAKNFDSRGERCTLNAINCFSKPYTDIQLPITITDVTFCKLFIEAKKVETLNVAGNRQQKSGIDIYLLSYNFLIRVFRTYMQMFG